MDNREIRMFRTLFGSTRRRPRVRVTGEAFAPETLEPRVLLSFSATSDVLSDPFHDSTHSSRNGPVQIDAVAQPGTEHDGFMIRVRNDGAPGEAFTRTFISLDRTLDASDVLVQETDRVMIQNGASEFIPESSSDAHFTMPTDLPQAFLGNFAYPIVQILNAAGEVEQTLIGTQPTYIHPSVEGRIDIVEPSFERRVGNLINDRPGVAVNQGVTLRSTTNTDDSSRLFGGSEVSLSGIISLGARSAAQYYEVLTQEEIVGKTLNVRVDLVGLDGSVSTITEVEDATFTPDGRSRRDPGLTFMAGGNFATIDLDSVGSSRSSSVYTLPSDIAPGAKFIRVTIDIAGQDPLVFTTDRPDVFISDGETSDVRWEDADWRGRFVSFDDPAGPGLIGTESDRRSGEDSQLTAFNIALLSADAGRIEEARLLHLVQQNRVAFALVPAASDRTWDPASAIAVTPTRINGTDLSDAGAVADELASLGDSDPTFWQVSFDLSGLGNARAITAGEYRIAALILNDQPDASDGPISADARHSSDATDPDYTNNLLVSNDTITIDQAIPAGGLREPTPADDFISSFRSSFGEGLAEGNSIITQLRTAVPDAAYSQADWTAENYWFQDGIGNVWSLWHGGAVHLREDGQHNWVLTNLADAGGLIGQIDFAPGSMSGVIASWRAFSIQGIANGQLVSLWWSPESGERQFGNRGNGWVLTPFTGDILRDPATGNARGDLPTFRSYTETQSNGRFTFDPRPDRQARDGGMSILLVDTNDNVYVATFSTNVQAEGVPQPERPNVWLLERLDDVPGIDRLDLRQSLDTWRADIRARAGGGR